ncbi:MAG TPA: hypothetical protein DCQ83_02895 [Fibrobacteres bacterium]|jgi:hypothetical protein|nr:hypothetical protein [Fibrobacterota bacterium]
MSGHSSHGGGYEKDEGFGGVLLMIPVSMFLLFVYVLICWFGATTSLSREMAHKQVMGAEALHQPLQQFRDQEDSSMHAYGMKDSEKGMVRIPIDRAMELMVKDASAKSK